VPHSFFFTFFLSIEMSKDGWHPLLSPLHPLQKALMNLYHNKQVKVLAFDDWDEPTSFQNYKLPMSGGRDWINVSVFEPFSAADRPRPSPPLKHKLTFLRG
jgi:hypothetical protein